MFDFINNFLLRPFYKKIKYLGPLFNSTWQLKMKTDEVPFKVKEIYFSVLKKLDIRNPIFQNHYLLLYTISHLCGIDYKTIIDHGKLLLFEKTVKDEIREGDFVLIKKRCCFDFDWYLGKVSEINKTALWIKSGWNHNELIILEDTTVIAKYLGEVNKEGRVFYVKINY